MDAKDLQRRWKEVVKTCVAELSSASPANKEKWAKTKEAAQGVVDSLTSVIAVEKAACNAWKDARMEKSDKPPPVLRLIS